MLWQYYIWILAILHRFVEQIVFLVRTDAKINEIHIHCLRGLHKIFSVPEHLARAVGFLSFLTATHFPVPFCVSNAHIFYNP